MSIISDLMFNTESHSAISELIFPIDLTRSSKTATASCGESERCFVSEDQCREQSWRTNSAGYSCRDISMIYMSKKSSV